MRAYLWGYWISKSKNLPLYCGDISSIYLLFLQILVELFSEISPQIPSIYEIYCGAVSLKFGMLRGYLLRF